MLSKIDDFLLDSFFQPRADWISDRFQKSIFMSARICTYLVIVNQIVINLVKSDGKANIVLFALASLFPLMLFALIRSEEINFERKGYGMMNKLRSDLRFVRFFNIVFVPFDVITDILLCMDGALSLFITCMYTVDSLLMVSAIYFASCTPKPPKPKTEEQEIPADAAFET